MRTNLSIIDSALFTGICVGCTVDDFGQLSCVQSYYTGGTSPEDPRCQQTPSEDPRLHLYTQLVWRGSFLRFKKDQKIFLKDSSKIYSL
jgi:hypothetical protein